MSDEDNLPKSACNNCIQTFEDFSLFIDKCKQNFETLKVATTLKCDQTDYFEGENFDGETYLLVVEDFCENETKTESLGSDEGPEKKNREY